MSGRSAVRRLRLGAPVVVLALMIAVFVLIPATQGYEFETFSVFNAIQVFGTYGLLALALGLTMIAGEFDLSTLGMFGLGGMLAVKLGTDEPIIGVLAALAVGGLAGVIQGGIMARLHINSMAVTLGGFLVLLGVTATIGKDQTISYENVDVGLMLDDPVLTIFSLHSLIVIAGFAVLGLVMHFTRIGRDVRAIGGDRETSRVAGVRVNVVLVSVFVVSGVLAGLAGALNSYSLASAQPIVGFPPLVFAATAALIGGIAIAGGQGSPGGIAAGALALSFLQATFGIVASPGWVTNLVTGAILAVAVVATAPQLQDRVLSARAALETRRARQGSAAP